MAIDLTFNVYAVLFLSLFFLARNPSTISKSKRQVEVLKEMEASSGLLP